MYPDADEPKRPKPRKPTRPWESRDNDSRYRIKALLGKGGMATVHKAFDRVLRRNVALKMLRKDRDSKSESNLARFIEEAQITAQIQHPGIVSLFDVGSMEGGRPFFTMNLVPGLTFEEILDDAIREGSEWSQIRLLQIFLKVCETLAFAHSRKVIHRDLKPGNIMVGEYGEVIIMDWGISKILSPYDTKKKEKGHVTTDTDTEGPDITSVRSVAALSTQYGQIIGTPQYMSPEQSRGRLDEIDERSDIYSLGVILYEILTGTLPFDEEAYMTAQYYEAEALPPHEFEPTISTELSRICMRCLAPERERRYRSVTELIRDMNLFLDRGSSFERRSVPSGSMIISKGEEAHEAYLILKGEAEVFERVEGKRISYATLKKGDTFGEIAVFTGAARNADVKALTDLEVLVFNREKVREELNKVQPWMGEMINSLAEKLDRLNLKYADLQLGQEGKGEG